MCICEIAIIYTYDRSRPPRGDAGTAFASGDTSRRPSSVFFRAGGQGSVVGNVSGCWKTALALFSLPVGSGRLRSSSPHDNQDCGA